MADWDIRDGIFRVPKDLARVPRHPETAEKLFQGVNAAIKRVLRLQGITITVEGAEHIPATGGALVAMNHTGYYDFAFMQVPPHIRGKRLVRFMAKREVFDIPVVGRVMRMMDHVSVDRSAGAASVGEAVRELERGRIVGIFPEATISRSFELKSFKNGAVRIARQAGVPLVPMVCWGSQRIWTKGGDKHLGRIKTPVWIRVGEPLELTGEVDRDIATLRETMQAMIDDVRAAYAREYGPFEKHADWLPAALGGAAPTLAEADAMDAADKAKKQQAKKQQAENK